MESFYRFCRKCLEEDVASLESFRKRQLHKSVVAILGAIETNLRPIVKNASKPTPLTPATCSWLKDTAESLKRVVEYTKEPTGHQTFFQSVILWCSSTEFTNEMKNEKQARDDATIDKVVDEALCRAFVILNSLYWTRSGKAFEIREDMDIAHAKFDFLGCSCDLRHKVRKVSNDVPQLREAAKEVYEDRMRWYQKEMQLQKQCASVCYEWQLFTLKHELDSVIIEKEDIIEDQQAQISELSTKLEKTITNSIPPHPKLSFTTAH